MTRHLKRVLSEALGDDIGAFAALLGRFRASLREGPRAAEARTILEALPYRLLLEDMRERGESAVATYLDGLLERPQAGELPGDAKASGPNLAKVTPVVLAGAGPGHPRLLTLMALDALGKAEVIVHDRLIPQETLNLAPAGCLLIPAEKRGHFESVRQEHIEALLIEHALAGKRVVRLKGGDPFVFGRGWEEVIALEARGIPWRLIPGLSSVTAGPSWAGIPLTHRGLARSFAVMSGMAYSQTNTEVPKADTIVLVMGLQRLKEIVPAFLAQGWAPETPVAALEKATMADQRICVSCLRDIEAETAKQGFDSPTLLVIGKVAGLRSLPKGGP